MDQTLKLDKTTVSELAIFLLSKNWPQSLKGIHAELSSQGKNVSMQAVHKSLSRLEKEKIVIKNSKQYSLNPEWLKQINDFSRQANKAYKTQETTALERQAAWMKKGFELGKINYKHRTELHD